MRLSCETLVYPFLFVLIDFIQCLDNLEFQKNRKYSPPSLAREKYKAYTSASWVIKVVSWEVNLQSVFF